MDADPKNKSCIENPSWVKVHKYYQQNVLKASNMSTATFHYIMFYFIEVYSVIRCSSYFRSGLKHHCIISL